MIEVKNTSIGSKDNVYLFKTEFKKMTHNIIILKQTQLFGYYCYFCCHYDETI